MSEQVAVRITAPSFAWIDHRHDVHTEQRGTVAMLPPRNARSCVASGLGVYADQEAKSVLTGQDSGQRQVVSDPPARDDLTKLPRIGITREAALNEEGVLTYHDLLHFLGTQAGALFMEQNNLDKYTDEIAKAAAELMEA